MAWQIKLNGNPLPWLLEDDVENPGVRWFALTDLQRRPADNWEVIAAKIKVSESGPVAKILAAQHPDGYWVKPGAGYSPKYRGTVWSLMFLAQLGADGAHPQVQAACNYVLDHSRAEVGGFSVNTRSSGLIHCLQGNLCAALIDLGWYGDERLWEALNWLARSITGEGIASSYQNIASLRYLKSGNCGPGFACSANNRMPCAWGAVKSMQALQKVPPEDRTVMMQDAIDIGIDFLFSKDPSVADYPMGYAEKPNASWFRFGYPLAYVTDVLQNLEVLTALGYAEDPRLQNAVELVLSKQDSQGRWKMEYSYNGKTWADIEKKGRPSKWVTLRALRVLKRVYGKVCPESESISANETNFSI